MVRNALAISLLAVLLCALAGCSKKVMPTTMAYRTYDTECLSKDASGAITLRVYGTGHDAKSARTDAARKAVEEVTFTNLTGNRANALALLPQPTARTAHGEYFNKFFKDGGDYKKYVKVDKVDDEDLLRGNGRVTAPFIVVVDREGLLKKYKKDKITQ